MTPEEKRLVDAAVALDDALMRPLFLLRMAKARMGASTVGWMNDQKRSAYVLGAETQAIEAAAEIERIVKRVAVPDPKH